MVRLARRLITDDLGASAAEYAMILAIIGGAIAMASLALGVAIGGAFERATTNIADCGGGC